jgi:DNA repair exonuclease SbcCD ATPase subunit
MKKLIRENLFMSNFDFLKSEFPKLYEIGVQIEKVYSAEEVTATVNCRKFIERLIDEIYKYKNKPIPKVEDKLQTKIDNLKYILDQRLQNTIHLFHQIRVAGNSAAHIKNEISHPSKKIIELTHKLSIKYYNYFQNTNLNEFAFIFPKSFKEQIENSEIEIKNKNLEADELKEKISNLESENNHVKIELEKNKSNESKYNELLRTQEKIQNELENSKMKEGDLKSEIKSIKDQVDRIIKEKDSVIKNKEEEFKKINLENENLFKKNQKLEDENLQKEKRLKNQRDYIKKQKDQQGEIIKDAEKKIKISKDKYILFPAILLIILVYFSFITKDKESSQINSEKKSSHEVITQRSFSKDMGFMDWFKANEVCLSNKMRLPSKEELKTAYRNGILETWRHGEYWSATESASGSAFVIDTKDGFIHSAFKDGLELKTKCIIID